MKTRNICYVAAALTWFGLAGCTSASSDAPAVTAGKSVEVSLTVGKAPAAGTRTSYENQNGIHQTRWTLNDRIGVFASDETGPLDVNVPFAVQDIDAAGTATLTGRLTDPTGNGSAYPATYYAYYPWQEIASADPSHLSWRLPDVQYPTPETFDGAADLLLGTKVETESPVGTMQLNGISVPLNFIFERPLAITALSFANLPEKVQGETVTGVTFRVEGGRIAGETLLSLTGDAPQFSMGEQTFDDILLDYEGKGFMLTPDFKVWIVMAPLTAASFDLRIETENFDIVRHVDAPAGSFDFQGGHLNTATVDLDESRAEITSKPIIVPIGPEANLFDVNFQAAGAFDRLAACEVTESEQAPETGFDPAVNSYVAHFTGEEGKSYYTIPFSTNDAIREALQHAFTLEFFYCIEGPTAEVSVVSYGANGAGGGSHFHTPGYDPKFWMNLNNEGKNVWNGCNPNRNVTNGTYVQFVIVYDESVRNLSIYMDGEFIRANTNIAGTPVLPSNVAAQLISLGCGTSNGNFFNYMTGCLAYARMYDRALTAEEVSALYSRITTRRSLTGVDRLVDQLENELPAKASTASGKELKALEKAIANGWNVVNDLSATQEHVDRVLADNDALLN